MSDAGRRGPASFHIQVNFRPIDWKLVVAPRHLRFCPMVSAVPDSAAWRQIAADLRERILSGDLPPGSPLPPEAQIAQHYEVGEGTLRRVMPLLRAEGLVVGGQGQVARVAESLNVQTVELHASDDPHVRARRATMGERRQLGLREGEWVIEVSIGGFIDLYGADRTKVHIVP